jgi:hypothetical protein
LTAFSVKSLEQLQGVGNMRLEKQRSMLSQHSYRVGYVSVNFRVFCVGVGFKQRQVVIEVLGNNSLAGGKHFAQAAEGHVFVALGVLFSCVLNQVRCQLLEVRSKLISH